MVANYVSKHLSRKLGLAIYALVYKDNVLQYKEALKKAETNYYTTTISNVQGNPRALFHTNNKLSPPANNLSLTAKILTWKKTTTT